jgi:DNA ligase (NAD+)
MTDVTKMTSVDSSAPMEIRIDFLRHCCATYEIGNSPISDAEYDREYYAVCEWLEENDPDNDFLNEVGGEHVYGAKVKHDVLMGSLNKSLDVDQFEEWLKKTYGDFIIKDKSLSFQLGHKIDGLSLGNIYENGKLLRSATRGDGAEGVDVTANAVYVQGVRKTIPYKDSIVEIRGECYKDRQDFYKTWHTSAGGAYANPRNFAAGSINQKDATVTRDRGLSFVAYEVVQKEFKTEKEKMEFLEKNGFPTLRTSTRWTKAGNSVKQIAQAADLYMKGIDRKKLPYDIDGVVVKVDDIAFGEAMGSVSKGRKPKSSRAIKFPPEESSPTPILRIEAQVGRTGKIAPVGIVDPVELGGAMIQRVSLHNYGALLKGDIHIGSKVIIAKKGDIIPQIVKVINDAYSKQMIPFPTECPSCNCLAQLNAKIDNWFKKIGVKGIGVGTISKLTNQDLIEWEGKPIIGSLQEMYYMLDNDRRSDHPFRKYAFLKEFFGEKAYANIIKSIKSVKEVPLHTFIEALGIARIGSMAKDIVDIAPTIEDINRLTVADVEALPGFGSVKAENFVNGWNASYKEIHLLKKYVVPVKQEADSDLLAGMKFCFTGSFSVKRTELQDIVVKNGGKNGSVGKGTTLVWDGQMTGGKYDKAVKLNCDILSEDDFYELIEE